MEVGCGDGPGGCCGGFSFTGVVEIPGGCEGADPGGGGDLEVEEF